MLDVGCGTGRVTEALLALVPRGRVLAIDASADMVEVARGRLGERAQVWCQDALELDLELDDAVDVVVSTAALHWVPDHDRLWARLADALRPGGMLEIQCGGEGNIDGVREVIDAAARDAAPSSWLVAVGLRRARSRPSGACVTPASPRRAAGSRSVRRIRRTWTRSCARRSSRRISSGCQRSAASRSRRRSSRECACAGLRAPERLAVRGRLEAGSDCEPELQTRSDQV